MCGKAINQQADIIFEDSNGEIDEIFEEDLPFDLNSDPIVPVSYTHLDVYKRQEKMLMVLAMIFGGHLLPFGWLYKSKSYMYLSLIHI